MHCSCAHDIWQVLITIHEGTSQVKKGKIDLLNYIIAFICLIINLLDDMLTCLTTITNALISLGKPIDNDQKVRKIIKALPQAWEVKATTLKELNDREEMNFTEGSCNRNEG